MVLERVSIFRWKLLFRYCNVIWVFGSLVKFVFMKIIYCFISTFFFTGCYFLHTKDLKKTIPINEKKWIEWYFYDGITTVGEYIDIVEFNGKRITIFKSNSLCDMEVIDQKSILVKTSKNIFYKIYDDTGGITVKIDSSYHCVLWYYVKVFCLCWSYFLTDVRVDYEEEMLISALMRRRFVSWVSSAGCY